MIKKPKLRLEFKIALGFFRIPSVYYLIIKYVNGHLYCDAIYRIDNGSTTCLKESRKNKRELPKNISKSVEL